MFNVHFGGDELQIIDETNLPESKENEDEPEVEDKNSN